MPRISGSSYPRYLLIVPVLALLLALTVAGCGTASQPEPTPTAPAVPTEDMTAPTADTGAPTATVAGGTGGTGGTGGIDSTQALIDALVNAGMAITPTGAIQQPFFTVSGQSYEAGTGYLQVFEYPDQAAAEADASKINPDGTIEGYSVNWVASPHFYQTGPLIVIYLGDDAADLAALQGVLGDPFATMQVRRLP